MIPSTTDTIQELPAAERIGPYLVQGKLGSGGMGSVFLAKHSTLGRRVAIKVLHAQYAQDPEIVQRFFNEARAVNIVDHPDVVQITEVDRLADGTTYLVMEHLQGESLRARLERSSPLAAREALGLVCQIAAPLAAAHAKGIVHRDLKPDNVMLVPDPSCPGKDRIKILDFGIAKVAAECLNSMAAGLKTSSSAILGTPVYMAPEQCCGAAQVDHKADVYSLGIMTYQMLSGSPPFQGNSLPQLLLMQIQATPAPLRSLDPTLSEEVAALVHSMLAKAPADRPSMPQVIQEISRLSRPDPGSRGTLSQAGGQSQPLLPQSWRHRGLIVIEVGILLCMILFGLRLRAHSKASVVVPPAPQQTTPLAAPPATAPPAVPARVRWSIDTDPPGALVVERSSEAVLGITPWGATRDAAPELARLVLRKEGFVAKHIELRQDAHATVHERLEPVATQTPPRKKGMVDFSRIKTNDDIPLRD